MIRWKNKSSEREKERDHVLQMQASGQWGEQVHQGFSVSN